VPENKDTKILLADDHAVFRSGLKLVLADLDPEAVILEAEDYTVALAIAAEEDGFDLALIDLAMPGMDDFAGLTALCKRLDHVPVVVVSASDDQTNVRRALQCGASGYIPKTLNASIIINALRLVVSGGFYLPPSLLGCEPGADSVPANAEDPVLVQLTPRQTDVLGLLSRGLSNKEVARELDLAEGTVKLHVTALLKVLGVTNRTHAVVKAASLGLAPVEGGNISEIA